MAAVWRGSLRRSRHAGHRRPRHGAGPAPETEQLYNVKATDVDAAADALPRKGDVAAVLLRDGCVVARQPSRRPFFPSVSLASALTGRPPRRSTPWPSALLSWNCPVRLLSSQGLTPRVVVAFFSAALLLHAQSRLSSVPRLVRVSTTLASIAGRYAEVSRHCPVPLPPSPFPLVAHPSHRSLPPFLVVLRTLECVFATYDRI